MKTLLMIPATAILVLTMFYIWSKLLGKKYNFRDYKLYLYYISIVCLSLINYFYTNKYIRIVGITLVFATFIKIIFKENIKNSIVTAIFYQMIIMTSELIFAFTISTILNLDAEQIMNTQFNNFLSNIIISIISVVIIFLPFIKPIYKKIVNFTDKISRKQVLITSLTLIFIASILATVMYYKFEFKYFLLFNCSITLFCFIILMSSYKNKNDFIKVSDKYNTTVNILNEYETMIDRFRVFNHENKNQLLTMRGMINNDEPNTIEFIDKIIGTKIHDNEKIMFETSFIPVGGIRGLVYSKILLMQQEDIKFQLSVSNDIRNSSIFVDDTDLMLDVCQILGVYLDNAIEEVKKLDIKNIFVEMYQHNGKMILAVSNNFTGTINLNKINEIGYTTKSDGHGYGLTLTQNIIEKNNKLSGETSIINDVFIQNLKIEM